MKLMISALSIATALFSCQAPQQASKSNLSDSIKGDWTSPMPESPGRRSRAFFSFNDTTVLSLVSWNQAARYSIKGDSLLINEASYKIGHLTNDSLTLSNETDTFHLTRISTKNNLEPSDIWFASGMCFGMCPSLALHIDAQRNIRFFGKRNSLEGGYSGKLSEADYAAILNNIRQLPALDSSYSAPWTDDQPSGIIIKAGNKTIQSAAYGYYKEPVEMRLLLNRLMAQYRHTDLKPDTSVTEEYFKATWELLSTAHPK